MASRWRILVALLGVVATPARAGAIARYLRDYQPGVEAALDVSTSTLRYEAPTVDDPPVGCEPIADRPQKMICHSSFSDGGMGLGVFAQHVFKRKGLFLFDADVAFRLFSLDATLPPPPPETTPPPVRTARLHLYGLDTKGYLQLGLTPKTLPDVLFSFGLGVQTAAGNIKINAMRKDVTVVAPVVYYELELVWLRFGAGALSSYLSVDAATQPKSIKARPIDGMSRFELVTSSVSLGLLKLVLPFP